jgi:hypothetical protein
MYTNIEAMSSLEENQPGDVNDPGKEQREGANSGSSHDKGANSGSSHGEGANYGSSHGDGANSGSSHGDADDPNHNAGKEHMRIDEEGAEIPPDGEV